TLKGMPEFDGVRNFERKDNGLVPVRVETWEQFVFVNLDAEAPPLADCLGTLVERVAPLGLSSLHYYSTTSYDIHCNWKADITCRTCTRVSTRCWITNNTPLKTRAVIVCSRVRW